MLLRWVAGRFGGHVGWYTTALDRRIDPVKGVRRVRRLDFGLELVVVVVDEAADVVGDFE